MKNSHLLLIFVFLMVLLTGFISGQPVNYPSPVGNESENDLLSKNFEEGVEIGTKGVEEEVGENFIKFVPEKNAFLNVSGHKFDNMKSSSQSGHDSFVKFDKKGNVTGADFTTKEEGGNYTINGFEFEVPGDSRVQYSQEKGLQLPEGSKIRETGRNTSIRSNSSELFVNGESYEFSGELGFDRDSSPYVPSNLTGNFTSVRGVSISNTKKGNNIYLGLGKRISGKRSASFVGKDNLVFESGDEGNLPVKFDKGNPYMTIEEGDWTAMDLKEGSKAHIKNRREDSSVEIPSVSVLGEADIEQDSKVIRNRGGEVSDTKLAHHEPGKLNSEIFDVERSDATTSPMELDFLGSRGKTEDKVLVDNFNRFAINPKKTDSGYLTGEREGMLGFENKISSRVKYNYFDKEDVERTLGETPVGIFGDVSQGEKQEILGTLRDSWNKLTPETKKSVNSINIMTEESFRKKHFYIVNDAAGFYNPADKSINIKKDANSFSLISHEAAHARHSDLSGAVPFSLSAAGVNLGEFNNKWESFHDESDLPFVESVSNWVVSAQEPPHSSLKGFFNKENEDYFSNRGKLDLLYEYDFITRDQYERVRESTGVNWKTGRYYS